MKKKAIIVSIKGTKLTSDEKKIFVDENPLGSNSFFKRNIKKLEQIKRIYSKIKKLTKDSKDIQF